MNGPDKKFPSYFDNFTLPEGAKEQKISVFRACKTQKVEKESFLPTYEENNFNHCEGNDSSDPGSYSLSTYEKPKDVKRFAATNRNFNPPFKIAMGFTEPVCGLCQRTKDRKPKHKSSHVDWWLYENATPHDYFTLIENFTEYYENFKKKGENENE